MEQQKPMYEKKKTSFLKIQVNESICIKKEKKKMFQIWNGKALHILVLQDDPAGQDFLGEAKFPLHELQPRQIKHYNVPLQDHYPVCIIRTLIPF